MPRPTRFAIRLTPAWLALAVLVSATDASPGRAFPQPPEKRGKSIATPASADTTTADSAATTAAPADSAATAGAPADTASAKGRAEALYARGYADARRAQALADSGRAGEARAAYESALHTFEEAVRLDDRSAPAWNMLGYCARRTGDLDRSFEAYDRCLALDPEYAPAHEYRGEAYLLHGEIAKAKYELAWLRARSSPLADSLASAIEAKEKGTAGEKTPGGW